MDFAEGLKVLFMVYGAVAVVAVLAAFALGAWLF